MLHTRSLGMYVLACIGFKDFLFNFEGVHLQADKDERLQKEEKYRRSCFLSR